MERVNDGKIEVYETREIITKTIPVKQIDDEISRITRALDSWKAYCDKMKLDLEKRLIKLQSQKGLLEAR